MILETFSALSLKPQELVSYILDFDKKRLLLKNSNSCKYYGIIPSTGDAEVMNVETMPNIAKLFDLFSYVMYYK